MLSCDDESSESDTAADVFALAHALILEDGPEIPMFPFYLRKSPFFRIPRFQFYEGRIALVKEVQIQMRRGDGLEGMHVPGCASPPQSRISGWAGGGRYSFVGEASRYLSRQCSINLRLVNVTASFGRYDILSLQRASDSRGPTWQF
jgi:hypothetical protein